MLALAVQLVFGATAPQPRAHISPVTQLAFLLADPGGICHGDDGSDSSDHKTPHHHDIDCLLCPCCSGIAVSIGLRVDHPSLPLPRAGVIAVATDVPPVGTLPPPPRFTASPRGPPIFG